VAVPDPKKAHRSEKKKPESQGEQTLGGKSHEEWRAVFETKRKTRKRLDTRVKGRCENIGDLDNDLVCYFKSGKVLHGTPEDLLRRLERMEAEPEFDLIEKESAEHPKVVVVPTVRELKILQAQIEEMKRQNEVLQDEVKKRKPPNRQWSEPKVPDGEKDPEKAEEQLTFCQIGDLRFGLYEEQLGNVLQAIKKAKLAADSEKVGHALDMVCVEFNVLYPGIDPDSEDDDENKLRIESAVSLVKRLQSMYRVKIPQLIDEETGEVYE